MFCQKCGAKIENENANFCPKCSAPINHEMKDNRIGNDKKETSKKKSKKKSIIIAIIIIVLGIAIAAGVLMINKDTGNDKEKDVETESTEKKPTKEKDNSNKEKVDSDKVIPGTSQNKALAIPLGTKVFGIIQPEKSAWFSFTTGETENAIYNVTYVNGTVDSKNIVGQVLDEYGESVTNTYEKWAHDDGKPTTLVCDELETNTTYYVALSSSSEKAKIEFSLVIKDPARKYTAYKTVGSFSDAGGTANGLGDNFVAGTNQGKATFLNLDTGVSGTIAPKENAWFSFTTGGTEGATYNVTYVNGTVDSQNVVGHVLDEYGESVTNTYEKWAHDDGKPTTLVCDKLETNTTYYVWLTSSDSDKKLKYSLKVKSPDEKKNEKATMVFEVPFEINETQVQFVPNKAEFLNEAKAKEVLKPVSEAILNAPKHSILIAGTTATDGKQESCVKLSNKRAEAVKKLLIDNYKVPNSQIKTIGLGYEADPFERGVDKDASGNFVESEAKKNRRVVILDVDDPIAKKLLS